MVKYPSIAQIKTALRAAKRYIDAGLSDVMAAVNGKPSLTGSTPVADGTAAVGTSAYAARADHVHPTDTTRVPTIGKGVNLLDNWYFNFESGGCVNQRNILNRYDNYFVCDRWKGHYGVNFGADTVRLLDQGSELHQAFDVSILVYLFLYAPQLTLSVLTQRGLYHSSASAQESDVMYEFESDTIIGLSAGIEYDTYSNTHRLILRDERSRDEPEIFIYAVKLEIGTEQTLARNTGTASDPQWVLNDPPPNYQQELAKCQRYYENEIVFFGQANANGELMITVPYKVPKRVTPALTVKDVNGNAGMVSLWNGTTWVSSSQGDVILHQTDGGGLFGARITVRNAGSYRIVRGVLTADADL